MPATPADIARYTSDGVVLTAPTDPAVTAAIEAEHIDARSGADQEIVTFFDSPADAQFFLNERFEHLSKVNPLHLGIEVEETLGLGDTVPLAPAVPTYRVIDRESGIDEVARTRAYAHDMGTDRFSIEVLA